MSVESEPWHVKVQRCYCSVPRQRRSGTKQKVVTERQSQNKQTNKQSGQVVVSCVGGACDACVAGWAGAGAGVWQGGVGRRKEQQVRMDNARWRRSREGNIFDFSRFFQLPALRCQHLSQDYQYISGLNIIE